MALTQTNPLEDWKKALGLQDWDIRVVDNCSPLDLSNPRHAGEVEYEEATKTAVIRFTKDATYKTLIHELLHIKFALLDDSGNPLQDRILHQIIDDLARALAGVAR